VSGQSTWIVGGALLILILLPGALAAVIAWGLPVIAGGLLVGQVLLTARIARVVLGLPAVHAELFLHGVLNALLGLVDLLRVVLRVLLGVILELVELAHGDLRSSSGPGGSPVLEFAAATPGSPGHTLTS